jgi:hypothetical protein
MVVGRLLFLASLTLAYLFLRRQGEDQRGSLTYTLQLAAAIVAASLFVPTIIITLLWPGFLAMLINRSAPHLNSVPIRLCALTICLIVGVGLGILRQWYALAFGLLQVIGGIAACWLALSLAAENRVGLEREVALAGGIFFIASGVIAALDFIKKLDLQPKAGPSPLAEAHARHVEDTRDYDG